MGESCVVRRSYRRAVPGIGWKLAKFVAKPPTGNTFNLPDATNNPTAEGGQLLFLDTFSLTNDNYPLPPSGWKGLGNPAGSTGSKYAGAGSPSKTAVMVCRSASSARRSSGDSSATAIRLDSG